MISLRKSRSSQAEKALSPEEQQAKINEVRYLLGPLSDRMRDFCSDACISRFLRARNWSTEKASKMLKETLKWRLEHKPGAIRWEDVAHEAETGKIYRTSYLDKYGRAILVMRPGFQNTSSTKGQIKYLVYCMENAILNLAADLEQMVWLIDFQGWTMASVSVKVTRETAHILQDYYPERLGLGILYNPPRIFESFWKIVKPFLDHKTYKKVKFVYSDDADSQKIMSDVFDMDKLETAFGGHNSAGFDFHQYAQRMKEDDQKMSTLLLNSGATVLPQEQPLDSILRSPDSSVSEASSDDSSSSDIASPKAAGISSSVDENDQKEQFSCKSSAGAEMEQKHELVGIKESV